jgi:farnesyl-diphosphate farnesyltransferase
VSGAPNESISGLRGPLLRSVSRSFYLSIRLLPVKLRDPIGLAYLLARATDTVADTAIVSAPERMAQLETLAALIQGSLPRDAASSLKRFAAVQDDAAERALILAIPECLGWLDGLPAADQQDIRKVLREINEGQALDVQRFGSGSGVVALETGAELDRYTYLVAGCVGEFWTTTCFRHVANFSVASEETMIAHGVAYGKALQLINILRDGGADLRGGRCYLPADELRSLGITPADLLSNPEAAVPVLRTWRERAEQGIAAGVDYACAIRSPRLRLATVLPALIGARTLALLREAGAAALATKVKVTRPEVRRILLTTVATLASPKTIREQFRRLSA